MLVMAFMAVSFLIISGLLYSTSNSALLGARHEQYYSAQEAATAATEKVVAAMLQDMRTDGRAAVRNNFDSGDYSILPTVAECPEWGDYQISVRVSRVHANTSSELLWKYRPLNATNDLYTVRAKAETLNADPPMVSVVEQDIQVAEIPLFDFQAFSEYDLTFITPPGNNITLNGRVHSNQGIYAYPSGALVFAQPVTTAGELLEEQHPADTANRALGSVSFGREGDSHANTMLLAPGSPDNLVVLQQIVDQASLVVVVSNNAVIVHDGVVAYPPTVWTNFLNLTNILNERIHFEDGRELVRVYVTDFDMAGFLSEYGSIWGSYAPRLVYLQDISYYGPETLAGFRIINGQQLPAGGLSLVTTNALYVKGNFNSVGKVPSMLAGDAVTLLSANWDDSFVGMSAAQSTTLNAAILSGTIPSDPVVFDGGFFNALRLLENWNGQTLTFTGALATPFKSQYAIEPWRGGEPYFYAAPAVRIFNYDTTFLTPSDLPKGTPPLFTLIRGELIPRPPGAF